MLTHLLTTTAALALTACAGNYTAPAGPRAPNTPVDRKVTLEIEDSLAVACGITVPHVFFDTDSAEVEPEFRGTLDEMARCVTTGPLSGQTIALVGHADLTGPADYNRELARKRADRVATFLTERGVHADQIVTQSLGEQLSGSTLPGKAFDRRVDIIRVSR